MVDRKRQSLYLTVGIWISIFLVIVILVLVFGKNFLFKRYASLEPGFTIVYPFDWTYKENMMQSPVIFFSPKDNRLDSFQENFSVVVQDLSGQKANLKEYSDMAVKQVSVVFKGAINILTDEDAALAGLPAHKFEYTAEGQGIAFHILHLWTIEDHTAYQLTYTALDSQFTRFLPKVQMMINSFRTK